MHLPIDDRMPNIISQIKRADKQDIDTIYFCNFLNALKRLFGLNLYADYSGIICFL